jgi:putative colanic acid biosynthesis acetyltransferase WcaF
MTRVRNDLFDGRQDLTRGRSKAVEAAWYLIKCAFFLSALPWPSSLKRALLRLFGARIGAHVYIKPRVNVHFPWKLEVGDHTWIGEEVYLLNMEPIVIGAHCCISQRAFLCTGNHDFRQVSMPFRNRSIVVEEGAWIGAQSFVGPGVTVGSEAVVAAGSVVTKSLPRGMRCAGNPCIVLGPRWRTPAAD